jgi:hypothetical protein
MRLTLFGTVIYVHSFLLSKFKPHPKSWIRPCIVARSDVLRTTWSYNVAQFYLTLGQLFLGKGHFCSELSFCGEKAD